MTQYCLYRMFDDQNNLLYVGQSIRLAERMHQHSKDKSWWPPQRIEIEQYENANALNDAERQVIQTEKPLHNVMHNKSIPKVRLTKTSCTSEKIETFKRSVDMLWEPIEVDNFIEDWDHYAEALYSRVAYKELRKALVQFKEWFSTWDIYVEGGTTEADLLGVVTSMVIALREPLRCFKCGGTGYPHISKPNEGYVYRLWSCECGATAKDNGFEFYGDMLREDQEY